MNKKEVASLFKFLRSIYPSFEVDQYKINTWSHMLADQDPARVMKNAERFALENKFPPVLADLREKNLEAYNSNILKQIKEWEKNAARQ